MLNSVNNRTLRGAFGDAVEGWTGKIIVVFPTTAEFRGKMGAGFAGAHPAAEASQPETDQGRAAAKARGRPSRAAAASKRQSRSPTIWTMRSRFEESSGGGLAVRAAQSAAASERRECRDQ